MLDRNLYGTTSSGGTYGFGTVFGVSPSGKERVIYSFEYGTDVMAPTGQPIDLADGKLYGTTDRCSGGENYLGTVFRSHSAGHGARATSFPTEYR